MCIARATDKTTITNVFSVNAKANHHEEVEVSRAGPPVHGIAKHPTGCCNRLATNHAHAAARIAPTSDFGIVSVVAVYVVKYAIDAVQSRYDLASPNQLMKYVPHQYVTRGR